MEKETLQMTMKVMPREDAAKLKGHFHRRGWGRYSKITERIMLEIKQGTLERESLVFEFPRLPDGTADKKSILGMYSALGGSLKKAKVPARVAVSLENSLIIIEKKEIDNA